MTAREYLSAARGLDRQIEAKLGEVKRLRERSAQITPQIGNDKVKSSGKGGFSDVVDRIIDLETEIGEEISELLRFEGEVRQKINSLDDSRHIIVLTDYYINCKTWEQVAADNHYSERHLRRLHGSALQEFRRKFNMK